MFKPFRSVQSTMGQHPMVTDIDAQRSKDIQAKDAQCDSGPAEEVGDKGQACQQMDQWDRDCVAPADLDRLDGRFRPRQCLAWVGRKDFGTSRFMAQRIRRRCIGNDFDRHQKVLVLVWLSCKKQMVLFLETCSSIPQAFWRVDLKNQDYRF